ncbi:MAG: 4-hydroxyphenylacetate 3-hydroxylase [Planctomycetota bacterium]|nr:MAG: 4-hydroxyphenylacetate 3-hydroxylase [Planctomycetota bacterium]
MRTGKEYLNSLDDGREIYIEGKRVENVVTHQAFSGVTQSVANLYDKYIEQKDEMTFTSPDSGESVPVSHMVPRSKEELIHRRKGLSISADNTFGHLGRSPDHVASFIAGFASDPDFFAESDPKFGENITRFHKKIREENSYLSYVIIPPQIDRTKTAQELADSHLAAGIYKERDDGLVIRGAQMLGTASTIADYIFLTCMTPLKPGDEAYAVSLVVPVNAKGVKLYPRRCYAMGQPSVFDYPLSTRFDETDSLVIFNDVFVPWEDVFVYRDIKKVREQFFRTPAHILGNNQAQIRLVTKSKFLLGLAKKLTETNGIDKLPPVMGQLGELASLVSIVEGMLLASEATAITNPKGVVIPNPRFLYGVMGLQAELYPRMINIIRELAGGGPLQVPSSVFELQNEETAADMNHYIRSANGTSAKDKIKLFKVIWELTGSEFAGRHQQYEMFYAGAPFVARNYSFMNYGFEEALELVDQCLEGFDVSS